MVVGYIGSQVSMQFNVLFVLHHQADTDTAGTEDRVTVEKGLGAHGFVLIYDQFYDTDRVKYALSAIEVSVCGR